MAAARPLKDVFADLAGDDAARPDAALAAGGHGELPADLVAEAVVSYADTAPVEVAEHLSPFVMAHSGVPVEAPVDETGWAELLATAPVVDADGLDEGLGGPDTVDGDLGGPDTVDGDLGGPDTVDGDLGGPDTVDGPDESGLGGPDTVEPGRADADDVDFGEGAADDAAAREAVDDGLDGPIATVVVAEEPAAPETGPDDVDTAPVDLSAGEGLDDLDGDGVDPAELDG